MHYFRASLLSCLLVNIINIVIFLNEEQRPPLQPSFAAQAH